MTTEININSAAPLDGFAIAKGETVHWWRGDMCAGCRNGCKHEHNPCMQRVPKEENTMSEAEKPTEEVLTEEGLEEMRKKLEAAEAAKEAAEAEKAPEPEPEKAEEGPAQAPTISSQTAGAVVPGINPAVDGPAEPVDGPPASESPPRVKPRPGQGVPAAKRAEAVELLRYIRANPDNFEMAKVDAFLRSLDV